MNQSQEILNMLPLDEVSRNKRVAELQPKTRVPVFHGSDMATIVEFVENGVDARRRVGRLFPHGATGPDAAFGNVVKQVDTGLFVSLDTATASGFGAYLIKFKALGKELHAIFPKTHGGMGNREAERQLKDAYPKSFRPLVSQSLLDPVRHGKGGQSLGESQARFVGVLSPRRIEKVYVRGKRVGQIATVMAPKDFIAWAEEKGGKSRVSKTVFEPQDKPTVEQFLNRLAKHYNQSREEMEKNIAWVIDGSTTVKDVVDRFMGGGLGEWHPTFLKHIAPKLIRYYAGKE
jgi:desulfoferrodoxin (superoxide reductase-like protein)